MRHPTRQKWIAEENQRQVPHWAVTHIHVSQILISMNFWCICLKCRFVTIAIGSYSGIFISKKGDARGKLLTTESS
jgi:hypothetical protein